MVRSIPGARMATTVAALLLALVGPVATAGGQVAMLPLSGQFSLDDVATMTRVDTALRRAAAPVQDVDTTEANVAAARGVGVDCHDPDDVVCLAKLAVLTDATRLLEPIARRDGSSVVVRIRVVDGDKRTAVVESTIPLNSDESMREASAALINNALHTPLDATTTTI